MAQSRSEKQRQFAVVAFAVCGAVMLFAYTNCGKANFQVENAALSSQAEGPGPVDQTGNPTDTSNSDSSDATTPDISKLTAKCNEAASAGQLKSTQQTIVFANPKSLVSGTVCQWGKDGNVAKNDGHMTARYEQFTEVNVPMNATLCDVKIAFAPQAFKFDDHFYMLFDNKILATDGNWLLSKLSKVSVPLDSQSGGGAVTVDLYSYDWSKMVGFDWDPFLLNSDKKSDNYCIGQENKLSNCMWPETEDPGTIKMEVDPRITLAIGASQKDKLHRFGMITVGDNDGDSDCQHQPLTFSVDIRYVE